jgi:hypothetical protein
MKLSAITRLRGCVRLLSVGVIVLLGSVSLSAQSNTGRIFGTVTDQSGGAVANAPVTVTNVQTGVARTLTTDTAGEYSAPNLLPGTYLVRVAVTGFQAVERKDILIETGRQVQVDLQLVPGQLNQTITVSEAVPLLDTTTATIGGTLSNQTINDLPLNGRNYQNLLVLRPGLQITPGGGSLTQTTNGLRPEDENYLVEGLDGNDAFSGQSITNSTLPSGDAATILPIDAIQEFNVEVDAPAEFGRKPGAVINVGLKSGTNSIHGTAYAFGRDGDWGARNYFNPAPAIKVPVGLEQWGGSVGGPIIKEKLFYFGAFENQRYNVGVSETVKIPSSVASSLASPAAGAAFSVPTAEAQLAAQCATPPAPAFCGPGGTFTPNALSLNLLPLYGTNTSTTTANTAFGTPNIININNAVGKVDYTLNSHHAFNGAYFFGNGTAISYDATYVNPLFQSTGRLRSQFVTSNWTWSPSSSWVNVARVGWTYYNRPVFTVDHTGTALSEYGLNTGVTSSILGGLPVIPISGLTSLGGGNNWPSLRGPNSNFDFVDQVSYLRGKHAFKFGGEVLYSRVTNGAYTRGRGQIFFNGGQAFKGSTGLEDFLAGLPTQGTILAGNATRNVSQKMYAGFLQDAWRVTPKITLNLGLRYDYNTVLKERNNLIGNWDPVAGLEQVGVNVNAPYSGYHKDLAPRIGVAWDLSGKQTTVLRAGGSLVYDDMPITLFIYQVGLNGGTVGLASVPTIYTRETATNGVYLAPINPTGGIGSAAVNLFSGLNWTTPNSPVPVFPASATGSSGLVCGNGNPGQPGPCSTVAMDPHVKTPYVGTWTLSLEHAITSNLSLDVAYVGDHASNLPGIVDVNQINPQSAAEIACGHCEAIANRPFGVQYPYLQYINEFESIDRSNYNGLQTTLTARNFHNLAFVLGYTYSHALDDSSHYFGANTPENSLNPGGEYGSSSFDVRQHFTFSTTYNIPGKKGWGQLLQGWQLNSIVHVQSGLPWTPTDTTGDISKSQEKTDRWNFSGNPADFSGYIPGTPQAIQYFAGNAAPAACASQAASAATLLTYGCYVSANGNSVLTPPAIGTFGNAGRDIFRQLPFKNWDVSVFKVWKLKERYSAQFRAEFFNVLNHPNFGAVTTAPTIGGGGLGSETETPDQAATNPTLGSGGPRDIQLGLKLIF